MFFFLGLGFSDLFWVWFQCFEAFGVVSQGCFHVFSVFQKNTWLFSRVFFGVFWQGCWVIWVEVVFFSFGLTNIKCQKLLFLGGKGWLE